MVEWSELFTTLVRKEVHPIFLRILLFIYKEQQCDVKWADLFRMLRREALGCHINDIFLGCFGYALLSKSGLQKMIKTCEQAGAELCQAQHSLSLDLDTN